MYAGSIAEREHQKWKQAEDIPNNPYSPEVLLKRLNSRSSRDMDMERLVAKSQASKLDESENDGEKMHTVVVGIAKPDITR